MNPSLGAPTITPMTVIKGCKAWTPISFFQLFHASDKQYEKRDGCQQSR